MKLRHNYPALRETCPRGLCVGRPAGTSFYGVHAPAASLASAHAGLRRRAGRNRIAAGANHQGAASHSAAPSALPRDPTPSGAPCAAHALPPRPAADRFALLRGLCLGRSAIAALRRGSRRSPRPVAAHSARRFALGGSRPLCVGIRSGRVRGLRFAPVPGVRSRGFAPAPVRPPPCAGAGSCPRPCRRPPPAVPEPVRSFRPSPSTVLNVY